MNNPYYIPRRRSPALDIARLGLGAYELYQKGQKQGIEKPLIEAKTRKALEAEKVYKNIMGMGETPDAGRRPGETLGEYTPEQKTAITSYTGLKFPEEEEAIAIPDKPMPASEIAMFKGGIANFDKTNKSKIGDALRPMMSWVERMASQGGRKYDIYRGAKAMLAQKAPLIKENLQTELNKAIESGDDTLVEEINGLIDKISDGSFIDSVMPACAARAAEEEATRKEPKLYDTTEGWLPTGRAIGLKKPTTTKPPTLKPMQNAKGQWTYHQYEPLANQWVDTGKVAQAPDKPMSEEDKNKRASILFKRASEIAEKKVRFDEGTIIDKAMALFAAVSGKTLEIGEPLTEDDMRTLEAQWAVEIQEINRQLKELGYKASEETTTPTGTSAADFISQYKTRVPKLKVGAKNY